MRVENLFSSMATHFPRPVRSVRSMCQLGRLVDLLLLINTELTRATVDQQEQTTNDREDLEEIVLGKVLVWVVLVELVIHVSCGRLGEETSLAESTKKKKRKLTVQKLLTNRLKMLRITTRSVALNLALNPTTTMTQAPAPRRDTRTRQMDHWPVKTNPIKRKMSRTRPASWKYILRSFSSSVGSPAKALVLRTHESERTMRRPPMTDRFRRKKLRSKIKP